MASARRPPRKKSPARIRHKLEPNGSATIPRNSSLTNVAEMPNTVSAPNHVAKTVAVTIGSGKLLPATAKSFAVWTRLAAARIAGVFGDSQLVRMLAAGRWGMLEPRDMPPANGKK